MSGVGVVADAEGFPVCTAPGSQGLPAVAANRSDYWVVWQDDRNRASTWVDIFAARVKPASGVVAEPDGIAICTAEDTQQRAAVASNGSDFLVVWESFEFATGTANDIHGARISGRGEVLDPERIVISAAADYEGKPVVASDGRDYFVAWHDQRNRTATRADIYGARVSSAGAVTDPNGIALCTALQDQVAPAVAFSGSGYFVVWEDHRADAFSGTATQGTQVDLQGIVLDNPSLLLSANAADEGPPAAVGGEAGRVLVVSQGFRHGSVRTVGNFVSSFVPAPSLSLTHSVGRVLLTWTSSVGVRYRVQYQDRLNDRWSDLGDDLVAVSPTASKTDDTIASIPRRFYRILLLP